MPPTMTNDVARMGLEELMGDLRQCRPTILADADELDSRGMTDARLTRHMQLLQSVHMTLSGVIPDENFRQCP